MYTVTGLNPIDGSPIEVSVSKGKIHAIHPGRRDEEAWLSAGFVDLQVNGYGGDDVNMNDPDPAAIIALTKKMIAVGVTTYLPTIITASEERITAALRAIVKARKSSRLVADCVPCVHVEGPHISPLEGFRGAHLAEYIRPPDLAEFARWQQASEGLVGMVTLSPHFEGTEEYIAKLTGQGVHVALGHTHASAQEIRRAVDAGARLSTHLGNGIAGVLPRHLNPIWTQLAEDRLTAMMIADGHHLPADTLKAMIRAKGVERAILVSDAAALAGMQPGIYDSPIGGRVELQPNGRLCLAGTEYLAGAALPLKDGIARAVTMTGISLGESLRMATENPGRFVGGVGVMRVGMPADLVRFSIENDGTGLRIESVFARGEEWQ
jgi:N-acetylglucosamine-6-phosphate deacetylase